MRILHVIPTFAPAWRWGGPVHAAVELTREQARQGHDVTVFTTNNDVDGTIDVPLCVPVLMDGVKIWYWPVGAPRSVTFSISLSHALRTNVERFDIVHIHSIFNWPTSIAAYWARRKDVPYIIRPAGSLAALALAKSYDATLSSLKSRTKKWLYFKALARVELEGAAALHFTSEPECEGARALGFRVPSVVVPLGVSPTPELDEAPRDGLRNQCPELRGRQIVLFLSRLDPIKGLEVLISALGQLARLRDDFALVVAGDGPQRYREKLAGLARRNGIGSKTIFLGPVFGEAKWRILAEADIFALTSYHENFGLAVAEALAAGVPVVISEHVNLEVEVRKARAGLVVGLSPADISAALNMLLDDSELRRDMGNRGRALVALRFAWPGVVERLTNTYLQLADRSLTAESPRSAVREPNRPHEENQHGSTLR